MENLDETKARVEEYSRIFASILKEENKFIFDSDLDEKSLVAVRMIYAKILEIRKLLDGINYNYIEEETEHAVVEPTTLFVIVRNILELTYVYEYVFLMPDTDEKREFAYYLYMYTGLKERLSLELGDEKKDEQIRKTVIKANEAKDKLLASPYYHGLSNQSQAIIQNRLNSPHPSYRLMFGDHEVAPVDYDKACVEIGMTGDFFKHMYGFLSTHAHPTYLSLVQFKEAYIGEKPLHDGFAGLAVTCLACILSILLEDARLQKPYIEAIYQELSDEMKARIAYYIKLTRVKVI